MNAEANRQVDMLHDPVGAAERERRPVREPAAHKAALRTAMAGHPMARPAMAAMHPAAMHPAAMHPAAMHPAAMHPAMHPAAMMRRQHAVAKQLHILAAHVATVSAPPHEVANRISVVAGHIETQPMPATELAAHVKALAQHVAVHPMAPPGVAMRITQLASHMPPRVAAQKIHTLAQVVAEPMPAHKMAAHVEALANHIEIYMPVRLPAHKAVDAMREIAHGLHMGKIAPQAAAAHLHAVAEAVHPAAHHAAAAEKNKLIIGLNEIAKRAAAMPPARLAMELHKAAAHPVIAEHSEIAAGMRKLASQVAAQKIAPHVAATHLHQVVIGISTGMIETKHAAVPFNLIASKPKRMAAVAPAGDRDFDDLMAPAGDEYYTGMDF